MKKSINFKIAILAIIFITGLLLLLVIIDYNKAQKKAFQDVAESTLYETMEQQKFGIAIKLNSELELLKSIASSIKTFNDEDSIKILLKTIETSTHYDSLVWVDKNLIGISQDGAISNLNECPAVSKAMAGETIIDGPVYFEKDKVMLITVATPSYNEQGKINGVVYGVYTPEKLKSLMLSSFNDKGATHIINSKGQYIASTVLDLNYNKDTTADVAALLSGAVFQKGSLESIFHDIQLKQGGELAFTKDDIQYHTAYSPLGINDWSIIITVPVDELISSAIDFQKRTGILSVSLGAIFFIVLVLFIYQEERATKKLFQTAYYDSLTGLANNHKFKIEGYKLMKKSPNDRFSCIIFDILNFKLINYSYGNKIGDIILTEIGKIGQSYMEQHPGEVLVSRLHSDVFVILSKETPHKDSEAIKTQLIGTLRDNVNMFRDIKLDVYLGRYISEPLEDISQVLEKAKVAHSHTKALIINEFCNYDSTIVEELYLINSILNEFDSALKNGEFVLYVQSQVDAQTEKMSGAEVLVRWLQNGKVKYRPDQFIPVLEKSGDIIRLDEYIREQVCIMLRRWEDNHIHLPSISVNVSRIDLLHPKFTQRILSLIEKYNLTPDKLHLEITETAYIHDHVNMITIVKELQSHGFCIEMDDFGSGYSSLNVLKDLPLDVLKLDMKFLKDYSDNSNGEIIVTAIIEMAQKLNLKVIAEGTETRQQANYLRSIGCNDLQGYCFASPIPVNDFENVLKEKANNL